MGHLVLGVFYGCVVPDDLTLRKRVGEPGEDELLDKWDATKVNRKLGLDTTGLGDKHLIGFWLGVGGDDRRAPDISEKCLVFTVIEKSKEAKRAIESWKAFATFSKNNGVHLPTPTFWIAPLEIA